MMKLPQRFNAARNCLKRTPTFPTGSHENSSIVIIIKHIHSFKSLLDLLSYTVEQRGYGQTH